MAVETVLILEIIGRPASYSSGAEPSWKAAVREAVRESGSGPWPVDRFSVVIELRGSGSADLVKRGIPRR